MKKLSLAIAGVFACMALNAATTIYVVDMGRAYQNFYKAKAAAEQINASIEVTKAELAKMDQNRQDLIKQVQAVQEKINNPALTEEAKKKLVSEAQPKVGEIQQIEANMRNVNQQATQRLQENANNIRKVHMEEILKIVAKVAAEKKADYIVEKGICYFSDPKVDITEDIIKAINANAPATK